MNSKENMQVHRFFIVFIICVKILLFYSNVKNFSWLRSNWWEDKEFWKTNENRIQILKYSHSKIFFWFCAFLWIKYNTKLCKNKFWLVPLKSWYQKMRKKKVDHKKIAWFGACFFLSIQKKIIQNRQFEFELRLYAIINAMPLTKAKPGK